MNRQGSGRYREGHALVECGPYPLNQRGLAVQPPLAISWLLNLTGMISVRRVRTWRAALHDSSLQRRPQRSGCH